MILGRFGTLSNAKRRLRPAEMTSGCIFHISQWININAIDAIVAISRANGSSSHQWSEQR